MRRNLLYLIFISFLFAGLNGCKDDSASAGSSLLEQEDQILVRVDTFPIQSGLVMCDSIISLPDSFLLGEMESSYGTMRAEVLTQFACPIGFVYPEDATVDSVCLCLCYRSWFGDGNTPMSIDAYEMDLATLDYATSYATNTDVRKFVSEDAASILAHEKIVVASNKKDSAYSQADDTYYPMVRARMSDEFTKRFFAIRDFSSQETFNQLFKGIYLRSDFGSATVLNIVDINISVYYSFSYSKAGNDTLVHDVKAFYANSEVRQVNCIDCDEQNRKWIATNTNGIYLVNADGSEIIKHFDMSNTALNIAFVHSPVNVKGLCEVLNYFSCIVFKSSVPQNFFSPNK